MVGFVKVRKPENVFFKSAFLILTTSTNAFHLTNLFCCFSRYQAATKSVAPSFFISTTHNPQFLRSDEGLTLNTSASESLYGGQFTLSTQLMKPNYLLVKVAFRKTTFSLSINLTNRFHVAVRLFSNWSQMTPKRKNKRVAHEAIAEFITDVSYYLCQRNKLLQKKLFYFKIVRHNSKAGLCPLWQRRKKPFDVIYCLYKMKQFNWLEHVAKVEQMWLKSSGDSITLRRERANS